MKLKGPSLGFRTGATIRTFFTKDGRIFVNEDTMENKEYLESIPSQLEYVGEKFTELN